MRYVKGKDAIGSSILRLILTAVFIISFSGLASADDPVFIQKDFQPVFHNVIPLNISNTGAATYSIPIEVPPGRGGITMPDLALVYNSQQKNGWVGVGWDLEIGSILRSTKWGVDYNGTDFVVDGAIELVPMSGYYGTKIEGGFTKYVFNGATSGWVATARDGTTYYYGTGSGSRQDNANGVFKWCLDQVVDTNGNTMTVTYTKDQGAIYPQRIDYPGNNYVIFTTESRPDAFPQYDTLASVVMDKRLKQIDVYGNGQHARRYILGYQQGTSSARSRLTSVQEYGSNGSSSLPPMTFGWQEGGDGHFGNGQSSSLNQGIFGPVRFGDINGDGRDDFVMNAMQHVYAYLSEGDGTFTQGIYTALNVGASGELYLFDVDGDGNADLLRISGSTAYTNHSNSNGTFQTNSQQSNLTIGPPFGYPHIGDVNGDGLADIVVKESGATNNVWIHLSHGDGTFESGISTNLDGVVEGGISVGDVNGDGFADIVLFLPSTWNCVYTYLSHGDGTFSVGTYHDVGGQIYDLQIADVNGDGLGDLLRKANVSGTSLYAHISYGDGTYSSGIQKNLESQHMSVADFNSDGCADLICHVSGWHLYVYLNQGDGTFGNAIQTNVNQGGQDFYFGDVNGDGLDDITQQNATYTMYAHLAQGAPPDLLTAASNGLGATTTISYMFSSLYQNTLLPFIVNTASTITVNDGNGVVSTTSYTYAGGYYDYVTREFWGFSNTVQTNPDGTTVTSLFHQDEFRKGRAYQFDFKNPSASLLTRQTLTWQTYPASPTTWAFVKLAQGLTYFYNSPTVYVQEDNTYDNTHGSLLTRTTSGTGAENITTTNTYGNYGTWLWRVTQETITGSTSGKVRETYYGYDGNGNMTSKALWLNGGTNPTITMSYDGYGNLRFLTDARGYTTETQYDDATYTYPKKVIYPQTQDGRDHIIEYQYNYRFGEVSWKKDERGHETAYAYDPFGRLSQVDYPDGGQQTIAYYDSAAPRYTLTKVKEEASGQTIDTYQYFDGLDRTILTITYGEDTKQIRSSAHYDTMGRIYRTEGPYFHPRPSAYPYVQTAYDYRGRPTSITSPDGYWGTITTSYGYSGFATTITDPDSKSKTETRDYLGRIIQVKEHAGGSTYYFSTYVYNAAGDLETVTDHADNTITNTYDTLGRKIAMDDPDLGHWDYVYDQNGNLISETNERTLVSVATETTEVHNTYDEMNRVESETKVIEEAPEQDYSTLYEYDLAGKVTKQTYPDDYEVDYAYHPGSGLLYTATGSGSEVYALCTQYEPTGKMGRIDHDNNTATTYTYDSKSTRLTGIVTVDSGASDIQDRTYTYSRAGDIIEIIDGIKGITYTYTYDNLHRLTSETNTGVYDPIDYSYNAIGNITQKTVGSNTYSYAYDTVKKHAVKTITLNGTPYQYTYDEVGNMTGGADFSDPGNIGTRTIAYYADNMPATIEHSTGGTTDFVYDGLGNRVRKQAQGSTTYYIGDHFELKDGAETKYIFAGNLRVAKVVGSEIDYYHKDHLSSSTVMTDATGTVTETTDYMPFGHERDHTGTVVTDYKFTDQELDTSTNLYNYDARHYDAVIGRFISADSMVQDWYDPQTLNRYSYCRNNPLIYVDPDGNVIQIPIGVYIYVTAILASPDTSLDMQFLAQSLASGDPFDIAGDVISILAPGVTAPEGRLVTRGVKGGGTRLIKCLRRSKKTATEIAEKAGKSSEEIIKKGSKRIPNPYGKLGGPEHQAKVKEIFEDIHSRDLIPEIEFKILTPEGEKSKRFLDIVGKNPVTGKVEEMHQVGHSTKKGLPISRERKPLDDIQKATKKKPIYHSLDE